ncbi:hypothetical protein AAF712_009378 [Marasmius tenuissimus]|uniref:Peptidase M24 domain-containing protein n=1 Tax=Marasmius tenuissimus TaxID=585030 RepID=A0ABR2ZQ23_9AGAR
MFESEIIKIPSLFVSKLRIRDARLGIDPQTISVQDAQVLTADLRKRGSKIVYPSHNFVDEIWDGRPAESNNPVFIHSIEFTGQYSTSPPVKTTEPLVIGQDAQSKLQRLREWMRDQGDDFDMFSDQPAAGTLITTLPEVAYLLNLRGSDIEFNPLFHAYLFVGPEKAVLFLNSVKAPPSVDTYLRDIGVERREYDDVWDFLGSREWDGKGKVIISPQTSAAIARALDHSTYIVLPAQVEIMKAIKNETEIKGLKRAYLRDGIRFTRFLAWLESQIKAGKELTEWEAARKLDDYRASAKFYQGLASENISATGPNAALPHYLPSQDRALVIGTDTPYLK